MKKTSVIISLSLTLTFISSLFCPSFVSYATDSSSDKIVVSLGDSYSSGEGIYDFYGFNSNRTFTNSKDENGNQIIKPGTQEMEDYLAHRSEGSWPGQLTIEGVGELNKQKGTQWYFEAVSGATTWNLGVDPSYLDQVLKMNENKLENGVISDNEYETIKNQIEIVKTGIGWRPIHQTISYLDTTFTMPYQLDVFDEIDCSKIEYVTMTMGGNDIGFSDIVKSATVLGGFDINEYYNKLNSAVDKFQNTIKYELYASYFAIQDKAGDQAKILIAGYPRLFSKIKTPQVIFPGGRQTFIPNYATLFNSMIEDIVNDCRINGGLNIFFVSVEGYFRGHEAYTIDPYIYGIDFISNEQDIKPDFTSARSMHPNEKGAKAYANAVQEYIDKFKTNGMVSGLIYIDDETLASKLLLNRNEVKTMQFVETNTGKTYDISLSDKYKGYYETYIPEGIYKISVEYSSNSLQTTKKYVQYGGKFDAELEIKKGEIIKNANFSIGNKTPLYDVYDPDLEYETTLMNEDELKAMIEPYGDILLWEYADYDANGQYEAFAITTTYSSLYDSNVQFDGIYFIDSEGNITVIDGEAYEDFAISGSFVEYYGKGFFWFDYSAGGSGWQTAVYSVKNGVPYKLDVSNKLQGFYYDEELNRITTTQNDYSNGVHEYPSYELIYDSDTQQFSIGERIVESSPSISETTSSEIYSSVLSMLYDSIESNNWSNYETCYGPATHQSLDISDISYLWYFNADPPSSLSEAGYQFIDLNFDGIEELIITRTDYDGIYDNIILNLYTIKDGVVTNLLASGENDRFYIDENNIICEEGSSGMYEGDHFTYYKIENGRLVPIEEYWDGGYENHTNGNNNWFYSSNPSIDEVSDNYMTISQSQYENGINSHTHKQLSLTPFSLR